MSVSLVVVALDSAGLSLVTCEFLLFSWVNFETSGLVLYVSLFVASLNSTGPSLVTCEYLLFSGVNFETSGLVLGGLPYHIVTISPCLNIE